MPRAPRFSISSSTSPPSALEAVRTELAAAASFSVVGAAVAELVEQVIGARSTLQSNAAALRADVAGIQQGLCGQICAAEVTVSQTLSDSSAAKLPETCVNISAIERVVEEQRVARALTGQQGAASVDANVPMMSELQAREDATGRAQDC